jgi:filamentous hemagglutinin family protein
MAPRPHRLALALAAGSLLTLPHAFAQVLPTGPVVAAGQAQIAVNGANMTVTNAANTILNWNSFSIGAQNAVRFQQPNAASQVLNRVTGTDPSQILGQLSSNGKVWLLNPNGVLFGQGARIDVAGLVTSTLRLNDQDWLSGRYAFSAGAPGAAVVNQGELRSTLGGRVVLLGGSVRNEGLIDAPGGQVLLAAGDSMELVDTGAPNLTVRLTAPQGEALNLGTLRASGGRIDVHAAVVNQQGLVQADGLSTGPAGEIVLQASERLNLADGSVTSAAAANGQGGSIQLLGREVGLFGSARVDASGASGGGQVLVGGGLQGKDASVPNAEAVYFGRDARIQADATVRGDGGRIILWSDKATRAFGSLSARGGAQGGDGGFIETSGGWLDARPLAIDVAAPQGKAGQWLLDPYNIEISDSPTESGYDASFTATADSASIGSGTIAAALNAGTNVTVSTGSGGTQAGRITVDTAHISVSSPNPGSLTLVADADISMVYSSLESYGGPLPVSLLAGRSGTGGISARGTTLRTNGGNLFLGGFGTGLDPDGGSFGNAAPSGVTIREASTLDAGAGRLEIRATASGSTPAAIAAGNGNSRLTGSDIVMRAHHPGGAGIVLTDVTMTAGHGIDLQGRGAGTGVLIDSAEYFTLLSVAPQATDSTATLSLKGRSDGTAAGVSVESSRNLTMSPTQLKVSNGASMAVLGANANTDPLSGTAAVVLNADFEAQPTDILLYSDASGGPISVRTFGAGNGISILGFMPNSQVTQAYMQADASSLSVEADGGWLTLGNGRLNAGGPIDLRADRITLSSGTTIRSTAGGDAIVLRAPGPDGLAAFTNDAGPGVLSAPNGRWIVWGSDILQASQNFLDGGLAYDFKRYGVADPSAWAGDSGNGFVFSASYGATISASVRDKVYDGNTTATLSGGTASGVNGDVGGLRPGATSAFADKNAGTDKQVFIPTAASFAIVDSNGKPVYGYGTQTSQILRATITPAVLSAGQVVALDKVYNGAIGADLRVSGIGGLVGAETVALRGVGQFGDKNVGTGKAVGNVQYILSDGANGGLASNYTFAAPGGTYSADITRLRINVNGLVASDKVYDASTRASLVGTAGVTALAGDQLTLNGTASAQFSDKNVGADKSVVLSGLSLGGVDAGNYLLNTVTRADITPLRLDVTGLVIGSSKVYDASTRASLSGTAGVRALAGDQLTLDGAASAQYSDRNVGTGKSVSVTGLRLGGADAGNYLLNPIAAQADITPAQLLYVADAVAHVLGTPPIAYSGHVTGWVGGDTQANASTGSAVFSAPPPSATPPGSHAVEGSGLSAQNYVFAQAPGNAQALRVLPARVEDAAARADVTVQAAVQALVPPTPQSSTTQGGLADVSTTPARRAPVAASAAAATDGTAATTATTATTTTAATATDFGSVRLGNLSTGDLQALLDARDRFKKTVFSESITKLEQDPSLADMQPCAELAQAAAGGCLVTAELRAQAQAAVPVPPAVAAAAQAASVAPSTAAAAPAPAVASRRRVQTASLPQIERKVALVIGVNRYADASIPQLGNAVGDAQALGRLFESKLGYETVVLENSGKAAVVAALNRLALELGPRDSALIYYAGHGELVESTGQGYWQLSDSDAKKPETWLSNADIARLLQQIGASQVALISDSCYSGSLAEGERIRATPGQADAGRLLSQKAVVTMSSGGNEPVFDEGKGGHSPFAWSLLNSLGQVAQWQPGGNVFERVRFAVARELPQRPRYGAGAGHQSGADYLFEQRQLEQNN